MKVKELIETLKQHNPEDEVVVYKKVKSYIGSQPGLEIDHIYAGFDWDSGRVFIKTK